jgi:hypothetical protein
MIRLRITICSVNLHCLYGLPYMYIITGFFNLHLDHVLLLSTFLHITNVSNGKVTCIRKILIYNLNRIETEFIVVAI